MKRPDGDALARVAGRALLTLAPLCVLSSSPFERYFADSPVEPEKEVVRDALDIFNANYICALC